MPFLNDSNSNPVVPLWINGKSHAAESDSNQFPVICAKSSQTIHNAVSATSSQATLACDTAAKAFKTWSRTSPTHRRNILLRVADLYEKNVDEIAKHQVAETSCPPPFAKWNIMTAARYIREIASATSEIRGTIPQRDTDPETGEETDGITLTVIEPIGTILIIPPWNGAVILPTRALTMALAAGCTVVMKASEKCPMTHHTLVGIYEEAGIPVGVINQVQVRREDAASVSETLIAHPTIRKIDFIGSANVGKLIGQTCAKYLKPILMELGGKGPAIVLDDANLERAANLCVTGAILHHGQLCFSTERIIVQRKISDEFILLLKNAMEKIPDAGNAVDKISADHAYEVLVDAQKNGATFVVGSPQYLSETSLKPVLVTNVTSKARIWDEETFGPSATIYTVDTDDEAIARANDSKYGLSAAVHSTSWERAFKVAKQLEYGQISINNMTVGDAATQPIRGVKGSGWGQSNSIWGIKEFLVEKTINFSPSDGARSFIH